MKMHLLTAEHFSVPGLITKAFATQQSADAEAARLVNIMLKDTLMQPTSTPDSWEPDIAKLQDYHGAAHCYVEISEIEVNGIEDNASATVGALTRAENFISGFEGDELQEGIAEILACLRTAITREQARTEVPNGADALAEGHANG